MDEREAWKFGFLLRCAEEGLDGPATADRARAALQKRADLADQAVSFGKGLLQLPGQAIRGAVGLAVPLGFSALAGGLGAGYLAGKATDPGYDADDVRRQEMIAAYEAAADDMDEDLRTRRELAR